MKTVHHSFASTEIYPDPQFLVQNWDDFFRRNQDTSSFSASTLSLSNLAVDLYGHSFIPPEPEPHWGQLKLRQWNDRSLFDYSDFRKLVDRDDPHHEAIESQVAELRRDAEEEGEAFNVQSAELLLRYCHELAADIQPAIVRLANGNLRALWQNKRKDQIGIQFLPDGQLQYVILRDRRGQTRKTLGFEDAETIEQIVATLGLTRLWFNG